MPQFYLPCEFGKKLKCTQENDTTFSHFGKAKYAYDFVSTETANFNICATADGVVKKVIDRNIKSGLNKSNPANYILIYHEENCYSLYYHIAQYSSKVSQGDIVKQGQIVAIAGNVGYATGIHLHFQIQQEESSWGQSIAFQFEETSQISKNQIHTSQNKLMKFAADYHEQASYPTLIAGGNAVEWWIKFKNTGDEIWENHNNNNRITKLALGTYSEPDMQEGRDFQCQWESPTRLAVVSPACVKPGEIGTFTFNIKAPSSLTPGKYQLHVTPKCPEGWLKQKDGQELNCFAVIQVDKKPLIEDVFDTATDNFITTCKTINDENDLYAQSSGMGALISANADIQNVKWEQDVCFPDDDVNLYVKCHDVPDGSQIQISILETDTQNSVTTPINGKVYNNSFEYLMKINWLDLYKPETNQESFVISAKIQNGDEQAALSENLQVDSLNFIFL